MSLAAVSGDAATGFLGIAFQVAFVRYLGFLGYVVGRMPGATAMLLLPGLLCLGVPCIVLADAAEVLLLIATAAGGLSDHFTIPRRVAIWLGQSTASVGMATMAAAMSSVAIARACGPGFLQGLRVIIMPCVAIAMFLVPEFKSLPETRATLSLRRTLIIGFYDVVVWVIITDRLQCVRKAACIAVFLLLSILCRLRNNATAKAIVLVMSLAFRGYSQAMQDLAEWNLAVTDLKRSQLNEVESAARWSRADIVALLGAVGGGVVGPVLGAVIVLWLPGIIRCVRERWQARHGQNDVEAARRPDLNRQAAAALARTQSESDSDWVTANIELEDVEHPDAADPVAPPLPPPVAHLPRQ